MELAAFKEVVANFNIKGELISVEQNTQGHINSTYRLTIDDNGIKKPYTLQTINKYVFKKPEIVMENICAVTKFLKKKILDSGGDPSRETLNVIPTIDNKSFFIDQDGEYWRVYDFISGATTYDSVINPRHIKNAGYAFGRFQTLLSDFPLSQLHDTIPDFHNTKKRLSDFLKAVDLDENNRAKHAESEIELIRSRFDFGATLCDMRISGDLPLRVTHNDTKYNNILIDDETDEALCVIDLDTVMPGLAAHDFGDAIRFAASTAAEDETDLSKIRIDLNCYEQFTEGFVSAVNGFLTPLEIETLPLGALIITLELASRFLLDYINGDKYFKIHRPNHNLERARSQLALFQDMEKNYEAMCDIVKKYT